MGHRGFMDWHDPLAFVLPKHRAVLIARSVDRDAERLIEGRLQRGL